MKRAKNMPTPEPKITTETPSTKNEPNVKAPTVEKREFILDPDDPSLADFDCVKPGYTEALEAAMALHTAQAEECRPIVEAELRRLMQVTPWLQLQAIHPHDGNATAPSGIFDNVESAVKHALRWNKDGRNINYLLNEHYLHLPVTNAIQDGKAIKNDDIERRRRLMLDVDPKKDEGESAATGEQMGYAEAVTVTILTDLHENYEIPIPDMHYSGNGVQSIWLLDVWMDTKTGELIEDFLSVCGKHSIADKANVDTGVYFRNQHARLPGTYNRKGNDTPERPQRMARRLDSLRGLVADEQPVLTQAMMQAVVDANTDYLASVRKRQTTVLQSLNATGGRFRTGAEALAEAEEFCEEFGISVTRKEHYGNAVYWRLDRCLYQEEREGANHTGKTNHAFIQIWVKGPEEGKIGAGCHRTDCRDDINGSGLGAWEYMKRLADPDYAATREKQEKVQETLDTLEKGGAKKPLRNS